MGEPPSPFVPYSYLPSTPSSTDGSPSPADEPPSPTHELPSPMDEPPSPLLKSRIPRKTIIADLETIIADPNDFPGIYNLQCPLRKGIIYYCLNGAIFEHNIYSSGKHEPRMIVPKHSLRDLLKISLVAIKGNQILLFANYITCRGRISDHFLHLSIHETHSDSRVGPALWSFNSSVDCNHRYDFDLELKKSTENPLAITFWDQFDDHWELFDIPTTTATDTSDNFPLIARRIDFDLKTKELKWVRKNSLVKLSPDRHILLNVDAGELRHNETIDIHYSNSGGTNFSFVTRMSIPIPIPKDLTFHLHNTLHLQEPKLVFSADGSKFAIVTNPGRVSVWDIQSKVPFKTFIFPHCYHVEYLQFSSGKLGKEVLVFVTHYSALPDVIHVIDATSFETEETFHFRTERRETRRAAPVAGVDALFFDPNGGTLYTALNGTLYEWDLQKNKRGPEWWIGEE